MSDPQTIKIVKELSRPGVLFSLARVAGGSRMFVGASDAKVYDLDVMAEKPVPQEMSGHESYVTGTVLAGSQLVSSAYDGRLIWWDTDTHQAIRTVDAHQRWIRELVVTPDGSRVVSVADDMVCRVWDVESGKLVHELRGHAEKTPNHFPSMLYACAVSPDGAYLATGDRVGHNVVWELSSGKQLATVETPTMYTWDPKQRIHSIGGVRSLAFSPDSSLLAIGGIGQIGNIDHLGGPARLELFDWRKNERTHEFSDGKIKGLNERLVFHPENKWLLAAGGDHKGFYQFFDLATNKSIKHDKAPMHIHDMVFDADTDKIYAVGHGKIVVWQMSAAEESAEEAATS
jgi:WD40 repeat protein